MHQKGLRSLWYDVHGYRAWTDPGGMIYRIKDLKKNELGQKYEDEIGPVLAHADGSEPKPSYLTNNEYFTGQLNNRKKLCEGGGGGGTGSSSLKPVIQDEEEEKEEEWKKYAAGIIPQFSGYDGGGGNGNGIADVSDQVFVDYVTAVPGVYTTPGAASPQSGGGSGKQKDTIDPLIPVGVKPLPKPPGKAGQQKEATVPPLPPFKYPEDEKPATPSKPKEPPLINIPVQKPGKEANPASVGSFGVTATDKKGDYSDPRSGINNQSTSVLSASEWKTQMPDDKACFRTCEAIIGKKAPRNLAIPVVSENSDHTKLVTATTAKKAMDEIEKSLANGKPIIVGVDHTLGRGYNEGTTDHFIVIVGSGVDTKGKYYSFFDPGTLHKDVGTSRENKLYLQKSGLYSGHRKGSNRNYTLSWVRPSL